MPEIVGVLPKVSGATRGGPWPARGAPKCTAARRQVLQKSLPPTNKHVKAEMQEAQLFRLWAMFDVLDKGVIELEEMVLCCKAIGVAVLPDEFWAMRQVADEDPAFPGKIQRHNFDKFLGPKVLEHDPLLDDCLTAYAQFDAGATGLVTVSNLRDMATLLGEEADDELLQLMVDEADSGGRGGITLPDFVEIVRVLPSQAVLDFEEEQDKWKLQNALLAYNSECKCRGLGRLDLWQAYVAAELKQSKHLISEVAAKVPVPSRLFFNQQMVKAQQLQMHFECPLTGQDFTFVTSDWVRWLTHSMLHAEAFGWPRVHHPHGTGTEEPSPLADYRQLAGAYSDARGARQAAASFAPLLKKALLLYDDHDDLAAELRRHGWFRVREFCPGKLDWVCTAKPPARVDKPAAATCAAAAGAAVSESPAAGAREGTGTTVATPTTKRGMFSSR